MRTIGIIPARYNSTRFPGKPLAPILGKPMLWWVYQHAKRCNLLHEVYVATDDDRIHSYCQSQKIKVVMTGPNSTGTDRIAEANASLHADYIVNIQGDEPLLSSHIISKAVRPDISHPVCLMAPTTDKMYDPATIKCAVSRNNRALYFSRSPIPTPKSSTPASGFKQICVYGFPWKTLEKFHSLTPQILETTESIELLRFLEHNIQVQMIRTKTDSTSVDYPTDIKTVESVLKSRFDAIIFDVDGVLLDSNKLKSDAFKQLFPISIRHKVNITKGGMSRVEKIKYVYKTLLDSEISDYQLQYLIQQYSDLTLDKVASLPPNPDILPVLKLKHIDFYIVSGTPIDDLIKILARNGLIQYFKGIYGGESDKAVHLHNICKNYKKSKTIYIGDRPSDRIESALAKCRFFQYNPKKSIQEIWL